MSFQLTVVTPTGEAFNGLVDGVVAPGLLGQFVVKTGHAAMVAALKSGQLDIVLADSRKRFAISDGVLEVDAKHQCLLLLEDVKLLD